TLIAAHVLEKLEDSKEYVKMINGACRKAVTEARAKGAGEPPDDFLGALSGLDAKFATQDIESVGDVVEQMTNAASLIANDARRKEVKSYVEGFAKGKVIDSGSSLLDLADPPLHMILLNPSLTSSRQLTCQLWRAWCRADQEDIIMAKFRPWDAHGQGQESGSAVIRQA
ncbi:unnamed protein product, partial [Ectocarpus fasciculatus]